MALEQSIQAIRDDPDSDALRLAYAERCELGDPARAELIRLQCRLERGDGDRADRADRTIDRARVDALLTEHRARWIGPDAERLPGVVGKGHAREIAFRGHRFDATRAKNIQLVNHVYDDLETLEKKAMEMAEEIAGNPPLAVQGAKEVMCFDEQADLEESLHYNAARSSMIIPSKDLFEAVSAYMEKRKGNFIGA